MPTVGVFAAIFDEHGRILCVKRDYGDRSSTLPGGGVEPGESPLAALEREVREESGYVVRAGGLIGVYATPWKDDLALCFAATILDRGPWAANTEITAVGFFARDSLPKPFSPRARSRLADAFDGRRGVVHVFEEAGPSMCEVTPCSSPG